MITFIQQLRERNETMFQFGLICLIASVIFLLLSRTTTVQVNNVSAWIKPFKFAFSTFLFAWAMLWYCSYLPDFNIRLFNWTIILLLGFEIVYIAIQAGRGQLSHFNASSPFYSAMFALMGLAATLVTLYTAYVAFLFFRNDFPSLPDYYIWSIRIALVIFVLFSFEGFVMGSRLSHTIGGPDGSPGIPLLHWSKQFGDPRVAHFIGMHALQVLPILSFYLLKDIRLTVVAGLLYLALAALTLMWALQGKPIIRQKNASHSSSKIL